MGRASRNVSGKVLLFADTMTESMEKAITETLRRRELQKAFNAEHGIVPKSVTRKVEEQLEIQDPLAEVTGKNQVKNIPTQEEKSIEELEAEMKAAAARLDFEEAARLRDILRSKN
jgi:excinuclease ABC subunit B